ncbi:MAG: carboxypeptidase-like regulatory domain-containing protein [Ignavibacteriales bacterium]|nr:carboxypeptidase-like regulatory domain-containing protein [Ignavibacteriales bacterium]
MKNKFLILISFLILFSNLTAQDNGTLRGFVADSLSGEALPYANVYIKELNRGANTDFRGYFIIASLPSSKLTVIISYVGYKSQQIIVKIEPDKVYDVKIRLASTNIQLRTIEAIGERVAKENDTDLSLQRITIRDLENLPKGVELDIFRALQTMPGVQTGGDVSARYFVRGSASNENLILLDNTPIYNPYHAMGILSAIDPDMISSMEFYKGGFPVDYTGRLSSVLKINTKNGNKNSVSGKAGLSLLTAKLFSEGPFPGGSYVLSGRKNYSDVVLKKFRNDNSVPSDFYDVFAKINIADDNFMTGAKFSLSTFFSADKVMNENPLLEDFQWKNNTLEFNYFQLSDTPLFYQIDISLSSFSGEKIPNESGSKFMKNEFNEYSMHADFNYVYDSKDVLAGGFKITEVYSLQTLTNNIGQMSTTELKGVSLSAYVKYQWLRNSFIGSDIGIRAHGTRLAGSGAKFLVEPRANFTLRIIPEIALKGSWGLFMQDLVTISDENETVLIFEPWVITPLYLTPPTAIHYITGIEINPSPNLSFDIEGYYKIMHNLALVNDKKTFVSDPDLIPGSGEAYGLEFQTKYELHPFNFTVSYSWMKALRVVRGITYPPRFDSRNNVNLTLEAGLGSGWSASAMWIYSSGLPFTQITGYYDKLSPIQLGDNPFLLNSYSPFRMLSTTNLGRLPDYHRLDLSLSKKIQIDHFKMSLDLSILNVYDRKNLFYFRRDTGVRVNMLPFLPSVNIKVEL